MNTVAREWRPGVSLQQQPASEHRVHKPVDGARHAELVARVGGLAADRR